MASLLTVFVMTVLAANENDDASSMVYAANETGVMHPSPTRVPAPDGSGHGFMVNENNQTYGTIKIPEPIMEPATIIVASSKPSEGLNVADCCSLMILHDRPSRRPVLVCDS
jgi:hypothetical protein